MSANTYPDDGGVSIAALRIAREASAAYGMNLAPREIEFGDIDYRGRTRIYARTLYLGVEANGTFTPDRQVAAT